MTDAQKAPVPTAKASSGKYLTFQLGRESYGIPVLKVREIIRLADITPVPQMPNFVKGVINLRGRIIPVIDLRAKFDLPPIEASQHTCIVVVRIETSPGFFTQMGLIIDAVEEVLHIAASEIEDVPSFGRSGEIDYILGMATIKGAVKSLLDIDRILQSGTVPALLHG